MHHIQTNLGELTEISTGKLDVNAGDPRGAYPFFTCGEEIQRINFFAFDTEAVLLAGNGNFGVKYYKGKFNAYQRTYLIEPIEVNGKWLFYAVKFNIEKITKHSRGSTIKYLRLGDIQRCPVTLTPLPEQERIVEKIETLFAEIDKGEEALREVQKLLARYRQSVLKAAVTGTLAADWRKANGKPTETGQDLLARILKLRRETGQGRGKYKEPEEPKTDGLPELPEGWAWASVEQLATVIGGLTKNKKRGELPLRRPMLRVANVYQDRLELDNVHETGVSEIELKRVALRKQDILVVEGNGSKDQIGRMALWNCEVPNAVHQNHLIKIRMHHPTIVAFAMRWFQSPQGRQNTESVASSSSGLHTLSISKINRLVVPIPNVGEIEEICERLDDAFAKIGHAEEWSATELKRCKALRQSILNDAFSGKLVPQDSSDEPAEKLLERILASRAAAARPTRKKIKA